MDGSRRKFLSFTGLWVIALCLLGVMVGCERGRQSGPAQVRIGSAVWDVDLATTTEQRYRGLGGRVHIGPGVGMLFVYPESAPRAYCMRDCLISLDIAFIDSNLRIVKIYTMPAEFDRVGRVVYTSNTPAQYVLEVAAGGLGRKGVVEGAKVELLGNIPPATKADSGP
jgi:uncharacterized membrane protein (UPF0127 family)